MKLLDKWAVKRIADSTDNDTIISNQISEFMRGLGVSTGGDNLSEVTYLTCLKA